ncbi:3'(2'),5'-bisphosphate nucleotidase CysQ [soil metagenome]
MKQWLEPVLALARDAGTAILQVYARDFAVSHKDDRSPLTEADMAAHHLIVDGLRLLTPELPVLSEESAAIGWDERRGWSRYWLVDPLDGTREFVKRNGEFTVNIALIEDGAPVLGVVFAPVLDEAHIGLRGEGAWLCDGSGRVQVAARRPATTPLRVAASRSHLDTRTASAIARMGDVERIGMGSSLKFCRLADARLDVYPRFAPTSEWDTAAGQCVLEAAGGIVMTLDGKPLRYNTKDSLLNPDFLALGDPGLPWRSWLDD